MRAMLPLSGRCASFAIAATLIAMTCNSGFGVVSVQAAEESTKEIIATQIRQQGFACEEPKKASRDASASKPNGVVWVLECKNATYRVRLRPNMAADVERQS